MVVGHLVPPPGSPLLPDSPPNFPMPPLPPPSGLQRRKKTPPEWAPHYRAPPVHRSPPRPAGSFRCTVPHWPPAGLRLRPVQIRLAAAAVIADLGVRVPGAGCLLKGDRIGYGRRRPVPSGPPPQRKRASPLPPPPHRYSSMVSSSTVPSDRLSRTTRPRS